MWTVPGNCGSGGIVAVHYFSQMWWPVGFLVFSQLPNHAHNRLVQSLYQPISLGVVGHSLQSLNASISHSSWIMLLVKLVPLSLRSLAGAPKREIKPPYRNLAMVFAVWSGVTYASTYLVKWSWKTKTLATGGDLSSSMVVSILVKSTCKRSSGAVATIGHKGAFGVLPSYWRHSWPPKTFL